ncbi:MAG TPA: hypothetical protein VK631_14870, partial [Solirubrobacteraceae bacterium]|nr:hypothetical protein [Solirubrobacteraceae bacterium]
SGAHPGPIARVYEAYLDATYVTKPVVSADLPTGTVTNTNLPTVTWSNTLDSDGGPQTQYVVRVFTDAQYTAPGFSFLTDTPVANTGTGTGAGHLVSGPVTSWQLNEVLPDDTYRAYVAIGQTVNGAAHFSDWAFTEFIVNVVLPGTPTLVATADNANGRIALAVIDVPGTASTDGFELERSLDAGTTWEAVRTLDAGSIDVPFVAETGVFASAADATSHALVLPAPTGGILADDLLLAVVAMDGNPTMTWPTGWTEIKDEAGNGSAVRVACAWYRAVGGESGTITLTTSASEGGGARILCIRNASATTAPEVSTGVSGAAANANPDSLNPTGWGTEPTLWIAAMGLDGNVAVTSGPSGYYDFGNTRWANASGAGVATASLLSVAASADPGAFTHVLEDSRAFTVGVRPRNASLTVYDYEAPNGTTMQYRARSLHDYNGVWAASAWATDTEAWTSTSWWLKHPHRPDLNMAVRVRSFASKQRAGRQGVFQALGATHAIVVSDTRGPVTGTVAFRLDSIAEQDDLDALLDTVATLMLQSPSGQGGPDYVRFADQDRQRVVDWASAAQVFDALTFTAVASPTGDVAVAWP